MENYSRGTYFSSQRYPKMAQAASEAMDGVVSKAVGTLERNV